MVPAQRARSVIRISSSSSRPTSVTVSPTRTPGMWPTSIVVPAGCRIALSVRGRDYEWQASTGAKLSNFKNELRGCGPFLHDDPRDPRFIRTVRRSGYQFVGALEK